MNICEVITKPYMCYILLLTIFPLSLNFSWQRIVTVNITNLFYISLLLFIIQIIKHLHFYNYFVIYKKKDIIFLLIMHVVIFDT